ncbi:amino acid ABC transporter permease [Pandoraea terrae]|uniref:Amino acid ABC transporter permease n=1 Tax=Pandoraea terrae TaxID=1537710 RepID=A0A5E4V9G6_9BURK|nr:ABC transporter permease subunit [Pandoraea terrae]VVE08878.1 amino acid ABC transporter permease [Pandoraea terrae]
MTKRPQQTRHIGWRSKTFRGLFYQALLLSLCVAGVWYLTHNTLLNMSARGIQSGWGFLRDSAGFDISESAIPYDALDPYWKAFLVGILNTVRVAVVGIVAATVLGTLLGVGRLSSNAIVRGFCYAYVELFRNVPVLLQLLMWYLFLTEALPSLDQAISFGGIALLSKDGLTLPVPVWKLGHATAGIGVVLGLIVAALYRRAARRHFETTGRQRSMVWLPIVIVACGGLVGWLIGGAPSAWSIPKVDGMLVQGGVPVTPEFLGVSLGLVLYTTAFIAEVVRAGLNAVAHGQSEAAASLGLPRHQAIRLVVLPQAMRVIIPPMTSQYLNLTKNSSLAVAIGYPDIVSVANTSLNQTGRAVECIAIIMAVYLTTSLSTSMFMNWYNRRAAIKER